MATLTKKKWLQETRLKSYKSPFFPPIRLVGTVRRDCRRLQSLPCRLLGVIGRRLRELDSLLLRRLGSSRSHQRHLYSSERPRRWRRRRGWPGHRGCRRGSCLRFFLLFLVSGEKGKAFLILFLRRWPRPSLLFPATLISSPRIVVRKSSSRRRFSRWV